MYVCAHMKLCPMADNALQKSNRLSNRNWSPRHELLVKTVQRLPKQYRLLLLTLAVSQRLKGRPYCWRWHTLKTQDLKSRAGSIQKAPLRSSFHYTTRCYASCQGSNQNSCLALIPMNHNNNQPNKMSLKVSNNGIHMLVVNKSGLGA